MILLSKILYIQHTTSSGLYGKDAWGDECFNLCLASIIPWYKFEEGRRQSGLNLNNKPAWFEHTAEKMKTGNTTHMAIEYWIKFS